MVDNFIHGQKPGVRVGKLELTLIREVIFDENDVEGLYQGASFLIVPLSIDDAQVDPPIQGNAIPHLTPTQISGLQQLMSDLVDKANTELYGG
jgi:hypothetical protein